MTTAGQGQTFVVRTADRDVSVEILSDGRTRVDGHPEPFNVAPAADGSWLVSDSERTWQVFAAGPPDARHVFVDGCSAVVEVVRAGSRRLRSRSHGEDASAPMPGTVIEIVVKPGQHVAAGDMLLKLEAMKMELPIRAPRDGVVAAVNCTAGELVQPGTVLVEIA